MTNKAKPKKKDKLPTSTETLINALKFVSMAQTNVGSVNRTHLRLSNQWAIAFDDVLTIGHKIDEDISACPHTIRFMDALKQCGDTMTITQLDSGRLSIKSGSFKAFVPCVEQSELNAGLPDPVSGLLDDRLRDGLLAVGDLATEGAKEVIQASVLLDPCMVSATDRMLMLQYWHGIDMPPGIVLPKIAVTAILKANKPMKAFGFTDRTFTVYFEDDSWIKTQLYTEKWPDLSRVLDVKTNAWPVPPELFKGLDAVMGFSEDGLIHLDRGMIRSHKADDVGATFELTGIPNELTFNAKRLKMLDGIIETIDLVGSKHITFFFGVNIRGAIMQNVW